MCTPSTCPRCLQVWSNPSFCTVRDVPQHYLLFVYYSAALHYQTHACHNYALKFLLYFGTLQPCGKKMNHSLRNIWSNVLVRIIHCTVWYKTATSTTYGRTHSTPPPPPTIGSGLQYPGRLKPGAKLLWFSFSILQTLKTYQYIVQFAINNTKQEVHGPFRTAWLLASIQRAIIRYIKPFLVNICC